MAVVNCQTCFHFREKVVGTFCTKEYKLVKPYRKDDGCRDYMNVHEYQMWTREVAKYPKKYALPYLVTGLCAEAGEVADKYAKFLRGDGIMDRAGFLKEVGDVLWFCARICDEEGVNLEDIMVENRRKLVDRLRRNVIKGSGDNR